MKLGNLLKCYLVFEPIAGLFYYYFKVNFFAYGMYFFTVFLMFLGACKIGKSDVRIVLWFLGFFSLIILSTLFEIVNFSHFSFSIFLKQAFGFFMILFMFLLGRKILIFDLIDESKKFLYLFLLIDFLVVVFFKLDLLNKNVYPSFESSYLIPTFVYSLVVSNKTMLLTHFLLFFLHDKRAVFIVAIFVFLLFYLFKEKSYSQKILVFFAFLIFLIFLTSLDLSEQGSGRYLNIYNAIVYSDLSYLSSLNEKVDEVTGSISLKNNTYNFILGNGLGWYYYIPDFYGDLVKRGYTHFTILFIFITSGVVGVILFIYCSVDIIIRSICSDNKRLKFYGYVVLAYVLLSFSVLNLFTNPLYSLFIGAFYFEKKNKFK